MKYVTAGEMKSITKENFDKLAPEYFKNLMSGKTGLNQHMQNAALNGSRCVGWELDELFHEYCKDKLTDLGFCVSTQETNFKTRKITISW